MINDIPEDYDQFVPQTDKNFLFIDWDLGNTCNFSCTYCDPSIHNGSVPWLDINKADYLIEEIRDNYQNKDFRLYNLLGGEPTAYPKLPQLIKKIKSIDPDTVIRIHTNGSRTPRYWKENCQYMDEVLISAHPEFINVETTCKNINILIENNVDVSVMVAMSVNSWDKCLDIANTIVRKTNALVSMKPLQKRLGGDEKMDYTEEQNSIMTSWNNGMHEIKINTDNPNYKTDYRATRFVTHNMRWVSTSTSKEIKVGDVNQLIIDDTNHWKGWDCYIGLDSIFIMKNGYVKAGSDCNPDYYLGNYFEKGPMKWPTKPITCAYDSCYCGADMATRKFKKYR